MRHATIIIVGILLLIAIFQVMAFLSIFILGAAAAVISMIGGRKFLETHTITPKTKKTPSEEGAPIYTDPTTIRERFDRVSR